MFSLFQLFLKKPIFSIRKLSTYLLELLLSNEFGTALFSFFLKSFYWILVLQTSHILDVVNKNFLGKVVSSASSKV